MTRVGRLLDNILPGSPAVRSANNNQSHSKVRTDQQLRESLKEIEDLKAALDEHAIVAITDPQGRITYVNDKFCAISNYSRDELLGQDHRIINSGFHPKEFIRDLWATIARGNVWKGEIKNRAKDGSFYWVDTTIVPFLKDDGKPRQYVAIRADITERKRMEMIAVHLAAIVKFSDDAIIGKNLDGTITSWNAGAEKIFGYSSDEMLGSSILRLIPADRHAEEHQIIEKIMHGEGVQNLETVRQSKGGRLINVSITSSPIKDSSGKTIGASKVARDITERKLAEEKIGRLNAELERRVVERTAELEAFSYSISHDLRAPLRAMGGFARMLQEDYAATFPPEARRQMERIHENAMKMGQLIDGLLAFSRLSRQPLNKRTVSPTKIANRVLEELQGELEGRHVTITVGDVPAGEADPTLLHQVFMNLLSNALKYSRRRDPAVIEVSAREENGRCVYFIKDNGAGFEMEYAHNLFGVFQRLHRADQFEGTGVGLAIVQRSIRRHGGRVWAEAEPDKGATFYFTLEGENTHV